MGTIYCRMEMEINNYRIEKNGNNVCKMELNGNNLLYNVN